MWLSYCKESDLSLLPSVGDHLSLIHIWWWWTGRSSAAQAVCRTAKWTFWPHWQRAATAILSGWGSSWEHRLFCSRRRRWASGGASGWRRALPPRDVYKRQERCFLLSPKIRNSQFLFDSKFLCYTFLAERKQTLLSGKRQTS